MLRKAGADARTARVSGNHDSAERATPACRRRTISVPKPEAEDRLPAVPGSAEIHSSGDRRTRAALRLEVDDFDGMVHRLQGQATLHPFQMNALPQATRLD